MNISDFIFTKINEIGDRTVYLAFKEEGKIKYTAWMVYKSTILKNRYIKKNINNQLFIIKNIHHPNVVKFIDRIITPEKFFILTEYYNGGTLKSFLDKYLNEHHQPPSEEIVQYIMRQIIEGLKYLHNKKIVYSDLKPEHIMINYENEYDKENNNIMKAKIIISDFFFARIIKKGKLSSKVVGTPKYMEPGNLNKLCRIPGYDNYGFDEKVDIWNLGIIFYKLLTGYNPFESTSRNELLQKVNKGDYYVPSALSQEAISFLNCMLQYYPTKRISIDILYNHRFLRKEINKFKKLNLTKFESCECGCEIKMNTRSEKFQKIFKDFEKDLDSEEEKEKLNSKITP